MRFYFARADYKSSSVVILGIPYDQTSSFIPGSRFAPGNIRIGAENIENYSPYQKRALPELAIYDAGDLIPDCPSDEFFIKVERKINSFLSKKKKVVSLGGEHTITFPCVRAYKRFYPDLCLLHLDAHADLRDEYLGEKLCHATVIRRVSEIVGKNNLFSLGIRSLTEECLQVAKNLYLFKVLEPLASIKKRLGKRPIYLTLDCDVLDGGLFPAVSTPEPAGISFGELIQTLSELSKLHLVGADIVEYNPLSCSPLAYASSVALILREVILALIK